MRGRVPLTGAWSELRRPAPTYPEYEQLHADATAAAAADGRFVDPAKLRHSQALRRGWEWRVRVLGHDRPPTLTELHMLLLADQRDLDPDAPQWLVDVRAQAEAADAEKKAARARRDQQDHDVWEKARAGCPVELEVRRNGTARVRGGYMHNLGHAVPPVDVVSGERKLRRHPAGRALCETEQRAKPLDLSGGTGGPATCVNCLKYTPLIRPA